jgi:hypothetical protein
MIRESLTNLPSPETLGNCRSRVRPELYARRLWHCIERDGMGKAARTP